MRTGKGAHALRYHHELVAVDAVTVGLPVWLAFRERDDDNVRGAQQLLVVGLAGYLTAVPTVHLLRDNPRGAQRSLGVRWALPALGFMAISATCVPKGGDNPNNKSDCGLTALILGTLATAPIAMAGDWVLFGTRVDAAPVVVPTDTGGATIGVAGRF